MHHLYPLAKGDPLCPLGFHPQVRWPTRCKRCFRDYKEHGGCGRKREDDFTASTPSLSTWSSPASRGRDAENDADGGKAGRGWASSSNLSTLDPAKKDVFSTGFNRTTSSWTSTPDLGADDADSTNAVTVNLKLPKRRLTGPLPSLDTGQNNAGRQRRRLGSGGILCMISNGRTLEDSGVAAAPRQLTTGALQSSGDCARIRIVVL